jgi:hypothetical protein
MLQCHARFSDHFREARGTHVGFALRATCYCEPLKLLLAYCIRRMSGPLVNLGWFLRRHHLFHRSVQSLAFVHNSMS